MNAFDSLLSVIGRRGSRRRRKMVNGILHQVLAQDFTAAPVLLVDQDVPLEFLERLSRTVGLGHAIHPIGEVLRTLIQKGPTYAAMVPIKEIRGVTASKGDLRMALDSLPETMGFVRGGDFGPLTEEGMASLRLAVTNEFFPDAGKDRYHLDHMTWVDAYVAHNTGASRRFALLRRLSPASDVVAALVTPYSLDVDGLRQMREAWRVAIGLGPRFAALLEEAVEIYPEEFFVTPLLTEREALSADTPVLFAIPYPHRLEHTAVEALLKLHQKIDDAGALDLGRYLTEQISQSVRAGVNVKVF